MSADHVQVALRVRPLNAREQASSKSVCLDCDDHSVNFIGSVPRANLIDGSQGILSAQKFVFDQVFPPFATQKDVFQFLGERNIIPCVMQGFNVCLFCYGQTASGKSYTLTGGVGGIPGSKGGGDDEGFVPRFFRALFRELSRNSQNLEISSPEVTVSYLEVYNERIRDLLVSDSGSLTIFEHPMLGVTVAGASSIAVNSAEEVGSLLLTGLRRRATAETLMNLRSSRSHTVLIANVKQWASTEFISSRINLVDLAGSERVDKSGVEGQGLREAGAINQSLSALGLVISQLAGRSTPFVAFRASKLTFLLKDSLSGNSRTWMVANVSPGLTEAEETLATLRFASSVKNLKISAVKNSVCLSQTQIIAALKAEIQELRSQILEKGGTSLLSSNEASAFEEELMARETLVDDFSRDRHVGIEEISRPISGPRIERISADPQLAGCLSWAFPTVPGKSVVIGTDVDCDIKITGLGILPRMCLIEYIQSLEFPGYQLTPLSGRIVINGSEVSRSVMLNNGDCLMLGRGFAGKIILSEDLQSNDLDRDTLYRPSLQDTELQELGVKVGLKKRDAIGNLLAEVREWVAEANELSAAIRPTWKFDLELVFNAEDVDEQVATEDYLVVRVLSRQQDNPHVIADRSTSKYRTTYLWTLAKFKSRLDSMRAIFESGGTAPDAFRDPWREVTDLEISTLLSVRENETRDRVRSSLGSILEEKRRKSLSEGGGGATSEMEISLDLIEKQLKRVFKESRRFVRDVRKLEIPEKYKMTP